VEFQLGIDKKLNVPIDHRKCNRIIKLRAKLFRNLK